MPSRTPIIAIVGRANVGKSSLYNAILGKREAIIAREAGTTRDSVMNKVNFNNQEFWLVDTAGMKDPEDDFEFTIQEQIIQATESADIIIVMVEADIPFNDEDRKVVKMALKSNKKTVLVINKVDKLNKSNEPEHFKKVGIKDYILMSVTQRRGIDQLLTYILKSIPKIEYKETSKSQEDQISIALIGRPNVGKSQLFNNILNKQQAIVSERAGTTRDLNRSNVKYHGTNLTFIDTAGIRRSGKIEVGIEKFSVLRTIAAIEESDICLLLMESNELNVQLDQKLAGLIKDASKGLILVISKWDIVEEKDPYLFDSLARQIRSNFDFIPWAPLIYTSAITGQNVTKIFDIVLDINKNRGLKLTTPILNKWLMRKVSAHPPAGLKNRTPKLNYIIQEKDNPAPAFKIFGSHTKYLHWSYKRYLERQLREEFGFEGTAIELWFIEKHVTHKVGERPITNKTI